MTKSGGLVCLLLAVGLLPLAAGAEPVVFWASDPVAGGETVLLTGTGLARPTEVTVQRLADGEAGTPPGGAPRVQGSPEKCTPWQPTEESLKFLVPEKVKSGLLRYEVSTAAGAVSGLLNRPVIWWLQGDQGLEGSPGGYLRVLGKNLLGSAKSATVYLQGTRSLKLEGTGDSWALQVPVPASVGEGLYRLYVHNGYGGAAGWSEPVAVTLRRSEPWPERVFSVVDHGANGRDAEDDTAAVQAALAAAGQAGGGVVYFPRGRYLVNQPLTIPLFTVLRGDSEDLSALLWPETDTPPKAWVTGTHHFGLEKLTLYFSNYTTVLTGEERGPTAGNVFLRRVRVRANIYRGHMSAEMQDKRYREGLGGFGGGHWLVQLGGNNVVIEDCDLYSSGCVISLREPRGCVIRNNLLGSGRWGGSGVFGGDLLIIENNRYYGASLTSWGGAGGLGYGNCSHVYIARNSFSLAHGGDREQITSDASGGLYYGKPAAVGESSVTLPDKLDKATARWVGAGVYVVSGRGMGQWRKIAAAEGSRLVLDRPWQVPPDESSLLEVTWLLSRWLVVGNSFSDVGVALQFYGISAEMIVAGNTCARAYGYQAIGKDYASYNIPVEERPTHQPTWYCQFLRNTISEGNTYRSGANNAILAGSSVIGIYGWPPTKDWPWPMAFGHVVRGNRLESNARIHVGGSANALPSARDVIVEHNSVSNSESGVELDAGAGNVLVRANRFQQVDQPLTGAGIEKAWVPPGERLAAWLVAVRTALGTMVSSDAALDRQLAAWQAEAALLPDDPARVEARRRELTIQIWKALAAQPEPLPPGVLTTLAGLRLQPQPETSNLSAVLEKGQGGTGEIKVEAFTYGWGLPLALSLTPRVPADWTTPSAATPVTIVPGNRQTLAVAVQVPEGVWGRRTIPVEVTAAYEEVQARTRLNVVLGRGTIAHWYVLGAFTHPAGVALDPAPHPPEFRLDLKGEYTAPAGKISWKPATAVAGKLDLNAVVDKGENLTAYAVTVIHAAQATAAHVAMQAEEGAEVWLQGVPVPGLRLAKSGRSEALVNLVAGENIFLLKVSKQTGPWSVRFSVDETGGRSGGNLRQLAAAEMLALAALTPPPLPPPTAGQELSWSEGVAWRQVVGEDFQGSLLAPGWNPVSGKWQVAEGVLIGTGPAAFLTLREQVPIPVRIEYDARSASPLDLSACFLENPADYNAGYLFGFGSGGNLEDKLLDHGERLADAPQPLAVPGKWHHVIAQILPGDRLQLIVDDKLALDARARGPVTAAAYPGVWTWGTAQFDNLRIYTGWLAA